MDLAGFARKRLDTRFVGGGAKMQFISTVSHKKHTKIVLVISSTKLNQFLYYLAHVILN